MRHWEKIFPEVDRTSYQKRRYGRQSPQTFGTKPALLIIDVSRNFVGSTPMPVIEAVDEYGSSCGEAAWVALENIKKLIMELVIQHL